MATIKHKRGTRAALDASPGLQQGELGLCTDTGELFIGNNGNHPILEQVAAKTLMGNTGSDKALPSAIPAADILEMIGGQAVIQYKVMPATVTEGAVVQYVGEDTTEYVNGSWYRSESGEWVLISGSGGGGTSNSPAIIDVTELPTTNINEDVFYRVMSAELVLRGKVTPFTVYTVDELPATGEPATTDMETVTAYFSVADNDIFAYIDSNLSAATGLPVGWYTLTMLGPAFGVEYGGILTDISQDPLDGKYRTWLKYSIYTYKDAWIAQSSIGWIGDSVGAEVFNCQDNESSGQYSHAEGYVTTASGNASHAEGGYTIASGYISHAEGFATTASGQDSHAEGSSTTASGNSSHAEGYGTDAEGDYSHAEGYRATASGERSHAEGDNTTASGADSHAEGGSTIAEGDYSHAEGCNTTAEGDYSHAEGYGTIAASDYQHVQGKYNIEDSANKYAHIVGNGEDADNRSNAHTVDWDGNAWYQGRIKVGGTGWNNATDEVVLKSDLATVSAAGLMPAADKKRMDSTVAHYYGECSTASTDATKVVTIDDFELSVGVQVTIKFANASGTDTEGDALTLNVNNTGAFPMRRYGTTAMGTATTTSGWTAGAIQTFTYDGAAWVREFWYNTTYSNVALGQGYATCSTAAATKAKTASLSSYSLTTGGIVAVRFTYDVPAGATLNINSKGAKAIHYRNAAITDGVIKAGDIATFIYSTYYRLISLDRGMTTLSDLGVTATAAELNYVGGVTSNIQTQLNNKQNKIAVSGILKGNGSTVQVAERGVDYVHPDDVSNATEAVPAYVVSEANRLADVVLSHQTDNCIRFLVMSDSHHTDSVANVLNGNKHAGQAAKIIANSIGLDFAAFLGDYTRGDANTSIAAGIGEIKAINGYIADAFCGIPNFRTVGNHDGLWSSETLNGETLSNAFLTGLIGSHMRHNDKGGSYGYADFERNKLRVICLNTADGAAENISDAQLKWFAETALDFTGKQDWQFMILSHHPLDWGNVYKASNILNAYITGASYSGNTVSANYSGVNGAAFIANFHGHTHCYKVDNLHSIANSAGTAYNAKRIATPNMCFNRNNEYGTNSRTEYYGIEFGEAVTYPKTADSAADTSFCVVTVDLNGGKIYADHYGAGYDRVIEYSTNIITYVNVIPTSEEYGSTAVYNGTGYKDGVYISSSAAPYDGTDNAFFATGFIPYSVPTTGLPQPIYIKGASWTADSHARFYFFDSNKSIIQLFINGNGTGGNAMSNYFSIDTLDANTNYYKLTPLPSTSGSNSMLIETSASTQYTSYIRLSLKGSGNGVIISLGNPI